MRKHAPSQIHIYDFTQKTPLTHTRPPTDTHNYIKVHIYEYTQTLLTHTDTRTDTKIHIQVYTQTGTHHLQPCSQHAYTWHKDPFYTHRYTILMGKTSGSV